MTKSSLVFNRIRVQYLEILNEIEMSMAIAFSGNLREFLATGKFNNPCRK